MASATEKRRPARFVLSMVAALVVAALVALAVAAVQVPRFFSNPARLSALVADLLPELRADVPIDAAKVGWVGPIVLEGITVRPRDGSQPPIRIGRAEISRGLLGMLLTAGDLGRIRVQGLEVDAVFDDDRGSNLERLFADEPETPGEAAKPPTVGPRSRRSPVSLRLEIDDARLTIAGPWSAEPWVSDPIDVRAALGPAPSGGHSHWTLEPVQLLTHARLEPPVAKSVLAYIAPVLADATRTGGEFSLRLDGASLPVGAPGSGTLAGVLSMHAVDLGPGPLAIKTFQELPFNIPPPPTVRIADQSHIRFRLADRRVWHEGLQFGLPLKKPGLRLDVESSGSVGIDDESLDLKFVLPIPSDLPQDRPLIGALAGKRISLGVGGVLGNPQIEFDGSIREAAGEVVSDLVERLRTRGAAPRVETEPRAPRPSEPPPPPTPEPSSAASGDAADDAAARRVEVIKSKLPEELRKDPTAEAVIDLVGGVLEEVARRRAAREAEGASNPGQPPPRRGGLLRRQQPPPTP
jgi:hypothetical protein